MGITTSYGSSRCVLLLVFPIIAQDLYKYDLYKESFLLTDIAVIPGRWMWEHFSGTRLSLVSTLLDPSRDDCLTGSTEVAD